MNKLAINAWAFGANKTKKMAKNFPSLANFTGKIYMQIAKKLICDYKSLFEVKK